VADSRLDSNRPVDETKAVGNRIQYGLVFVILTFLTSIGCGTAAGSSTNRSHSLVASAKEASVNPKYPIVIYDDPNYVKESQGVAIQSWWTGQVSVSNMLKVTKDDSLWQAPWKSDPVEVSQVATVNFAPPRMMEDSKDGKAVWNQEISYVFHGHTISYTLASETKATKSTPEMAVVVTSGLQQNLRISLYLPVGRYHWVIYKVEMLN